MQTTKKELITKSDLISRGWTVGLINKHLGEPDELKTNPHYKSGPPMHLYAMSRVETLESKEWFLAAKSKRVARSAVATKVATDKRERLMQWVESLPITIPSMPLARLLKIACEHYNYIHEFQRWASIDDSPEFLTFAMS